MLLLLQERQLSKVIRQKPHRHAPFSGGSELNMVSWRYMYRYSPWSVTLYVPVYGVADGGWRLRSHGRNGELKTMVSFDFFTIKLFK